MSKEWKIFIYFLIYAILFSLFLKSPISGGSSYSPNSKGTEAFFEFLKKDNRKVLRWEESVLQLSESKLPHESTLLLISPKRIPPIKPLLEWVERGHNLIFFLPQKGFDSQLLNDIGLRIEKNIFSKNSILNKESSVEIEAICEAGFSGSQCLKEYRWLEKVRSIEGSKRIFAAKVNDNKSIKKYFNDGKASLLIKSLEKNILENKNAFILALKNHGKGQVLLLPDASIIQNSNIDKADNFRMLYQLLESSSNIYFDEFSHGFKKPLESEIKSQVVLIKISIAVLFFTLSLAAVSRAIRFGKPLLESPPVTDASLDLIQTRGKLYKKHFASSALIDYIKVWKERLGAEKNISSELDNDVFLEKLFDKIELDQSEKNSLQKSIEILSKAQDGNLKAFNNYEKEVSNLEKIFRF